MADNVDLGEIESRESDDELLLQPNDPEGDIINESGNYTVGHRGISLSYKGHHPRQQGAWQLNHQEAAIYLQEGEDNDKFYTHPRSYEALPAYEIAHNKWFYLLDLAAALLVLCLAAFERPTVNAIQLPVGVHGSLEIFGLLLLGLELGTIIIIFRCRQVHGSLEILGLLFLGLELGTIITIFSSPEPKAHKVHGSLEIFGLLLLGLELGIRMKWLGLRVYFTHPRTVLKTLVLSVVFVEAVVVIIRQTNHFRVTRALRPMFLLDSYYARGVRRIARQTLQSLPPILDMLGLLLFVMLIFSILGFYLFSSIPDCEYFQTIQNSFISLFILLTTANYPDVMMPAYNVSRFYALFFIAYLAIELYFIMNLLLAVVYDTFSGLEKTKLRKLFFHKRQGCQLAFRLLVTKKDPNAVNLRSFYGAMLYFRPNLSRKEVYLMFKALNTEKTGKLTLDEFYNMYDVTDLDWKPKNADAALWSSNFRHPCNKAFKYLNRFVNWKWFDYVIYLVILANFVWILVETIRLSAEGIEVHSYKFSGTYASIVFVIVYCVEAMIKILGKGPKEYFTNGWDVFDFLVTVVSLIGVLGQAFSDGFYYITVLRPFRLLRLFKIKRRYRDVLGTFFILMNRLTSLAIVIILVYYFFAIIGMEVFLNEDLKNCCKNSSVESYYAYSEDGSTQGYYYLNNFDNIFISGVTLFELTVVNNWFIIMMNLALECAYAEFRQDAQWCWKEFQEGYAKHTGEWSRVYFMSFYIVMMVVLNIVVAFILEMFLFRIAYRRQMHLEDIEAHEKYKVDVSLSEEEEVMCNNTDIILTGNHIITQSSSMDIEKPYKYRGERMRSKQDFSLRMYSDEVKNWILEDKMERQNTIIGMEQLRSRNRPNSQIL